MRVVPLDKVKRGMRLGQNIYRNDGLLALPKGVVLKKQELDVLRYHRLEYLIVLEKDDSTGTKENDIHFTLNILEAAYTHCTLWEKSFGKELYEIVSKRIIKKRKLKKYLNKLRTLDSYSYAHCINVSILVAQMLKFQHRMDEHLGDLILLSLFHDIGRIKLNHFFNKEGKLEEEEFEQLKKHPILSMSMLKGIGFSKHELKFVAETHEKWDGSGYPFRIKGNEIEELAQIIYISDVYNALSSYRPYRGVYSPYDIVNIIKSEKNKSFGEEYVHFFLKKFIPYPIGTKVELNDGRTAIVVKVKESQKVLPIIEVFSEDAETREALLDLSQHKEIRIQRVFSR
jgi:HD-GYP domain-containing protein (c-di-GMP phosphodiesterase class II)